MEPLVSIGSERLEIAMPNAEFSTDTLVYEAVQRIYRNAVVSYARNRLGAELGEDLGPQIRKLYIKEWDDITRSAQLAASTGATGRVPKDELDHLSVNHFRALFEKFWGVLGPPSAASHPEFSTKIRSQFCSHLDDVVGLRNPVSHPPEDPLPLLDAIRCLDAARRIASRLALKEAESGIDGILDQLIDRAARGGAESETETTHLEANLPPRESVVTDFVGRSREIKELWAWLLADAAPRWMLVGDGGKGKSATAFRFALDVKAAAPQPLAIVHWLSAKQRRFEDGQTVVTGAADFTNLEAAVDWLLQGYGWAELVAEDLEVKREALLNLLGEFPALVILDDIDTLPPEADDVAEFFLLEVAKTRSKVLVTSRRTYTGMGRSRTVVDGLSEDDARAFLASRLSLMELQDLTLSEKRIARIFEATERSPLYMEDLLRLAKFYQIDRAIDVWMSHKGDPAREYALNREIELLSASARSVLEVCAVVPAAATVDELARCTALDEGAVESAITELHQMYLVPGPQIVEDTPRYQLNRNLAQLIRKLLREGPRHDEVQNAVQAVFGRIGRSGGDTTISDITRQAQVYLRGGNHDRAIELLEAALERHPNQPGLYAMVGKVQASRRPVAGIDARQAFERAYQLRCTDPGMYQLWANLHLGEEDWARAAAAAEAGVQQASADDPRLLQTAGYARSRLARKLRDTFVADRAAAEARTAEEHLAAAIRHSRGGNVRADVVFRIYRSWVKNADLMVSLDGVPKKAPSLCERLRAWLEHSPMDARVREEVAFYKERCPEIANLLGEMPSL